MRSKQRIHEIQDTVTSFEENFETLAFEPICVGNINQEIKAHKDEVFPTVNVHIAGRGKEETTLKAKIDTGAQGNVLPLYPHLSQHVPPKYQRQRQTKAKNTEPIKSHSSSIWWLRNQALRYSQNPM